MPQPGRQEKLFPQVSSEVTQQRGMQEPQELRTQFIFQLSVHIWRKDALNDLVKVVRPHFTRTLLNGLLGVEFG